MSFISFRMKFTEDDEETRENLCLPISSLSAEITVNTDLICSFNNNSITGGTMLRMANGDVYNAPISIERFRRFMEETEPILKLAEKLSEN